MQNKNKSLSMQDTPDHSPSPSKSQRFRAFLRKITFKVLFKGLEVLLMILEIVQCLCEIFKR